MPIDMSAAAKAPPRKATSGARSTRQSAPLAVAESVADRRTKGLMGLAQLGQGACVMFGQHADGAAIGMHAGPVATELANLADNYEVLAKPIDFLIEIGPFGGLIAAALPLALQLMANHKIVNASALYAQGVVPPEVLKAQMEAQMMQMQAEAMRKQQQALRAANEAKAEFEAMMSDAGMATAA